jgi:hypothetical protein
VGELLNNLQIEEQNMHDDLKTKNDGAQGQHFGVIDFTVHYTLGAGLAEQLGDNVEFAVLGAISTLGDSGNKFLFDGSMIRKEVFWHCRREEGTLIMRPNRTLSLHLSNDREDNVSFSVDWFYF